MGEVKHLNISLKHISENILNGGIMKNLCKFVTVVYLYAQSVLRLSYLENIIVFSVPCYLLTLNLALC